MGCLGASLTVPLPGLPGGITLGASLPAVTFAPGLCCKLQPLTAIPAASVGVPVSIPGAVVAALLAIDAAVDAVLDAASFSVPCPGD